MISRKLLWFIGLALAGVLAVTWWAGSYPARVVVVNQGALARDVRITTAGQEFPIGNLRPAGTRVVTIPSGDFVTIDFEASRHRTWRSPEKIVPAQSLTVFIRGEQIDMKKPGVR
ncbi:MAG TPA: hypothetical protein VLV78_14995 [Thermoanaerobaculia bacterium]|nr:hypothetical protein [Thermoanaerobaculia bacterium]